VPLTVENRVLALQLAVQFEESHTTAQPSDVTSAATMFYRWLEGPAILVLTHDSVTYSQAAPDGPGTPTIMKGNTVQLTDLQQVTLTVAEQDSKGQPVTGDALTWTVDNTAAVAITPSVDGLSCLCVAGVDGIATVTVTDATVTPPLTATDVITVVSSAATGLVITEGTPENQPPAAPAA
jgi:hypothetical protein